MSPCLRPLMLSAALVVTACGSSAPSSSQQQGLGGERPCTMAGAMRGFGLDIDPAFAPKVSAAAISVCWGGSCQTPNISLFPSSKTVDDGCQGQTCGAHAVPTGGKSAYIQVPGLPTQSVRITLTLTDAAGAPLEPKTIEVVPKLVYPNGPDCGGAAPQANLEVTADGTLRAR